MILYNIVRTDENIEIFNQDTAPMAVSIKANKNCENFNESEFTIQPGESTVYKMEIDGKYVVSLNLIGPEAIEVPPEFTIPYYNNFLLNLIDTLEDTMCRCDDCDDCVKDDELLSAYFKCLTYYTLTKQYYSAFIDKIMECAECSITKEINSIVTNERYIGSYSNPRFLKQLLAYYYFSFYFAEVSESNEEEVKTKFKYNSIVSCLQGNVDVYCIEQKLSTMASFTINSDPYQNQPPSTVGNITISVGNRATRQFNLADFTSNTTPAYSDPEGDPVDAVRFDSLPADGLIELDGTPITAGQIVSAADITAGLLVFTSPNQDASDSDTFNFSVRDTGSMTFVS